MGRNFLRKNFIWKELSKHKNKNIAMITLMKSNSHYYLTQSKTIITSIAFLFLSRILFSICKTSIENMIKIQKTNFQQRKKFF